MMNDELKEYMDRLRALPVSEIIQEFAKAKKKLEAAKKVKTEWQKKYDAIRLNILPERLEEEDTSTVTVRGAGRVALQSDLYFSIPADSREEAFRWLRENGHGDIIKPTVNSSTGKAFAKECIKSGIQLPEDLFKVTPYTRAQLTEVKE